MKKVGRQSKKSPKEERADLVWQCTIMQGHCCEGYSDDKRVDCTLCSNFLEGIKRRKKARAVEKETTIHQTIISAGEELLLMDRGSFYLFVIGKRIKDEPNPDIFKVEKKLNLTFNDINSISVFLQVAGLAILDKKMPAKNR